MVILTDGLSDKPDEGFLKVATGVVKEIKKIRPSVKVVSCGERSSVADENVGKSKLFLSKKIKKAIGEEDVLYVPKASSTTGSAIRTYNLSERGKRKVAVLLTMDYPLGKIASRFFEKSNAKLFVLSERMKQSLSKSVKNRVRLLKTGIDTDEFFKVTPDEKARLRKKYGFGEDDTIVLHAGHMNYNRNADKLALAEDKYKVLFVVSSATKKDEKLRRFLLERKNVTLFERYADKMRELYQIADIYLFPVKEDNACIETPLSVLEAIACGLPVLTTEYGQLKEFRGVDGITFIDEINKRTLNEKIAEVLAEKKSADVKVIEKYSFKNCASVILEEKEREDKS